MDRQESTAVPAWLVTVLTCRDCQLAPLQAGTGVGDYLDAERAPEIVLHLLAVEIPRQLDITPAAMR